MSSLPSKYQTALNGSLAENIVRFGRCLKKDGIPVSTGEILDAAEAIREIPILDRIAFYFALRSTLVKNPELFERYDLLFEQFWSGNELKLEQDVHPSTKMKLREEEPLVTVEMRQMNTNQQEERKTPRDFAIYSSVERMTQRDLKPVYLPENIRKIKRLIRRFNRRFATRKRRRIITSRKGRIDLFKSMRKSVSHGSSDVLLIQSDKKIARSKVVALADVSGSMDDGSEENYLMFYLLKNVLNKCELFVFSTELVHLNGLFNFSDFRDTARRISKQVHIWGSGTRIGACFQRFLEKYSSFVDKDTTILIISDGWDLGGPELLNESMYLLRSKCNRIIWLNPYVGTAGYEPSCLGMKTALPYVDIFASPKVFTSKTLFDKCFGKETSPYPQVISPIRKKRTPS